MTLLAPMAALGVGLAGGLVVLTFYLLKLRRRPVRVSTTMFWEDHTRDLEANVPFRWVRPSWLLFLHLLIIALLAIAFGRPAIRTPGAAAERAVILIDRSASMSSIDAPDGPTRLDLAKERAIEIARDLLRGSATRVQVMAYASEAAPVTRFTSNLSELTAGVRAIEATDQPDDPAGALRVVEALNQGVDEEGDQFRVLAVLVSDGGHAENLTASGVDLRYERTGDRVRPNAGIVALSARRDYRDPATVRVFARIASTEPRSLVATLLLNGTEQQRRAIELVEREDGLPEASAAFETVTSRGGIVTVEIDGADALAPDDSATLVVAPLRPPRIALVVPDEDPEDRAWALRSVLEELTTAGVQTLSKRRYDGRAENGQTAWDIVVLDRVRPDAPPDVPSLSFGAGVGEMTVTIPSNPSPTRVVSWERSSPVLRHVGLDGVYVSRPGIISGTEPAHILTLARGSDGPLIAFDERSRRVVVAFDLAQSNWPVQFGFPVFLANTIEVLSPGGTSEMGRALRTDEPVRVRAGRGVERVSLIDSADQRVSQATVGVGGFADLGVIARSGVYRAEGADESARVVAVNVLDANETSIIVRESVEFAGSPAQSVRAGGFVLREVWHWFVIAAAILLAIEWVLYGLRMRI